MKKLRILSLIIMLIFCFNQSVFSNALDYYNAAQKKYTSGKLDQSINLYKKALEADPAFAMAYVNLGKIHLIRNEFKKAENIFHQAILHDPTNSIPYSSLGEIYLSQGNFTKAKQFFEDSLERETNNDETRLFYAETLLKLELTDESLKELNILLKNSPDFQKAMILKSKLLSNVYNNKKEAEEILKNVLKKDKYNRDAIYELGLIYQYSKKYKAAINKYNEIVNDRNQEFSAEIIYKIAQCYEKLDLNQKSILYFKKALVRSPNYSKIRNDLGKLLFKIGEIESAKIEFSQAYRTNPTLVDSGINFGKCLYISGDIEDAIEVYKNLIIHNTGVPELYNQLGIAYIMAEEYDFAISAFEHTIQMNNNLDSPYYNLGSIYEIQGKFDKSIEMYQTCLTFAPDNILAMNNLGFVYLNLKRYDDAITILNKAVSKKRTFTWPYYNLALAYYNRGNKKKSEEILKILFKYEKKDTNLYKAALKIEDLIQGF